MIINVYWSACKIPGFFFFQILKKLNFLDRFSKHTKIKFHENSSSGTRVVPCGRTDGPLNGREEIRQRQQSLFASLRKRLKSNVETERERDRETERENGTGNDRPILIPKSLLN